MPIFEIFHNYTKLTDKVDKIDIGENIPAKNKIKPRPLAKHLLLSLRILDSKMVMLY